MRDPGYYIPLDECEDAAVYKIHSRNLAVGVFVKARNGFIGIREKFGARYLFMEYHWDTGEPYGTVHPEKKLAVTIPEGVELDESLGTVDEKTGKPVKFSKTPDKGGNGKAFQPDKDGNAETITVEGWCWAGTGEQGKDIRPVTLNNKVLFEFLDSLPKESA